jgi:cell cycle related kinase
VAIKKVKLRKVEDGMPKEAIREIESQELIADSEEADRYIVKIREVFVGKTSLNIVYFPFCKKGDLHSFLSVGPQLTIDQAWAITFQLLQALDIVHSQALLMHRDIKPSNILIDSCSLKLCDFG